MTYADELRNARGKAQVAYVEFTLQTRCAGDGLFCFFEEEKGGDIPYYLPRIKKYIQSVFPIKCGGREKVLKVHSLIKNHTEYDKYKKAYFIDRDFNLPLQTLEPPVFETPCYSVENLFVSVKVFKEILMSVLGVSLASDEYNICVQLFTDRQIEFHNAVRLFNAWYACLIEIRNTTGKTTGVCLDDKFPKDFIDITLTNVASNYDLSKIKQVFPAATTVDDSIVIQKETEFASCDQKSVFRGKYEMQFLLTVFELLMKDSTTTKQFLSKKPKFSFGEKLSNEQAISVFSSCAETPESLDLYLQQFV